jgi:hypothetical protein
MGIPPTGSETAMHVLKLRTDTRGFDSSANFPRLQS